jgi:hypothetical protein
MASKKSDFLSFWFYPPTPQKGWEFYWFGNFPKEEDSVNFKQADSRFPSNRVNSGYPLKKILTFILAKLPVVHP